MGSFWDLVVFIAVFRVVVFVFPILVAFLVLFVPPPFSVSSPALPLRLPPPWLTKRAVSLKTRSIGTSPFELPLVPAMYEPLARIFCIARPTPAGK